MFDPIRDLWTIFASGERRILGCHPRTARVGSIFPVFAEEDHPEIKLVPESEWTDCSKRHILYHIFDQDGIGSCNANAACQTLMLWRNELGLPKAILSPGNLYGRINGGRDQGSMLSDALLELMKVGVCRTDFCNPNDWKKNTYKQGWDNDAKRYAILEGFDCPTFAHIASAIQLGFFVDFGIMVNQSFEPDSEGVIPPMSGRGGGGHAMTAIGMKKIGGMWHVETVNSWGEKWGLKGVCFIPQTYFKGDFVDAWANRGGIIPSDETILNN